MTGRRLYRLCKPLEGSDYKGIDMTEDKAKTKWCPFARPVMLSDKNGVWVPQGRKAEFDKDGRVKSIEARCIGSECMAWRWIDALTVPQKDRRGCCGLAGRP